MDKAAPVIDWLLGDGRKTGHRMRAFTAAVCERIVAADIPVARVFAGLRVLHDQPLGQRATWIVGLPIVSVFAITFLPADVAQTLPSIVRPRSMPELIDVPPPPLK